MDKKMIFHHPLPILPNATSASGIRPLKMIQAFESIGYEVVVICGYGKERKQRIRNVKKRINNGECFSFVYSESSTMPTLLTEEHHLPTFPFVDFRFFSFCKKKGVKIGLFYRDIYWLFPVKTNLLIFKRLFAKLFYYYDLFQYKKLVDKLFLPSMKMGDFIPLLDSSIFSALPPGHDVNECGSKSIDKNGQIELLYVGGVGVHYRMDKLFSVLEKFPNIKLTLCTRRIEWESSGLSESVGANVSVVYKSGDELFDLYKQADIALLFVESDEYRSFAMPVKLFEYLGCQKPVIATSATLAGDFVEENLVGWTIDYEEEALENLLNKLIVSPFLFEDAIRNIRRVKHLHSWKMRALKVEELLGNL